MTGKRKTTKTKSEGGISITGGVSGAGNVVGHGSQSHVSVQGRQTPAQLSSRERTIWVRLVAFLLALAGTLVAIALFARLLQGLDVLTMVELIFAALVAALGISGTIKPQALAELLAKLTSKS